MKKAFIYFLLLFLTSIQGLAQNFNKLIMVDSTFTTNRGCVVINDKIYVVGYMNNDTQGTNCIKSYIIKFDANGNELLHTTFSNYRYNHWVILTPPIAINNKIYVSGYMRDTTNNPNSYPPFHIYLLKIDTNLSYSVIMNLADSSTAYMVAEHLNSDSKNNIYITGSNNKLHNGVPERTLQPFIIKVDTSGNLLSQKYFPIINVPNVRAGDPIINNNNLFMTLYGDSLMYIGCASPVNNIRTINYLLRLDSACNLIATTNYSDSNALIASTILYNDRFYNCGTHINRRINLFNGCGSIWGKPALFKYNDNYQRIALDTFGSDSRDEKCFLKIKKIQNESTILMVGHNMRYDFVSGYADRNGIITKTDTLGNLIWSHQYHGFNANFAESVFLDEDFLSDGSIIACGWTMTRDGGVKIYNQGWLIRLSPDGCLSPSDCGMYLDAPAPTIATNTQALNILLFPNPSSDELSIKIEDNQTGFPIQLTVYDLVGKQISTYELTQSQQTINTSKLLPGQYFAVFSKNGKRLSLQKFEHF